MSGEMVIIRGSKGEPFVARIFSTTVDMVYVTGDENYEQLNKGLAGALPLSIPRSDVFQYSSTSYNELFKTWRNNPTAWNKLPLWEDTSNASR